MSLFGSVILIAASAAFVGLVHSLAPGHWLPVVLTMKARRWSLRKAALGALVAASGHILLSIAIGLISVQMGSLFFHEHEEHIERFSGVTLILFGLIYAGLAYFRHSTCHGHSHHGPDPKKNERTPFLFLFTLGLSPCVAVIPVFLAAAPMGAAAVGLSMAAFAGGVIAALVGATGLVSFGVMKLDHPLLEHYGDVITGLGVAVMGTVLLLLGAS